MSLARDLTIGGFVLLSCLCYLISAHFVINNVTVNYPYSLDMRIECYNCTTRDPQCKYTPKDFVSCPFLATGCFSYYADDQHMARGCATATDPYYMSCLRTKMRNCFYCEFDLCNSSPFRVRRTMACVTSTIPPEEEPHIVPKRCIGEIPVAVPDPCYSILGLRNGIYTVIERGCFPYQGEIGEHNALFYCYDQGCNVYGAKNLISCNDARLTTENWLAQNSSGVSAGHLCQNKTQHQFPAMCFNRLRDDNFRDGCLSDLRSFFEVKECSFYENNQHRRCQTCVTSSNCNFLIRHLNESFKILVRCMNEHSNIVVCSSIYMPCYMHVDLGRVVQAGCAEPTVGWHILTHINTHFCTDKHQPCFETSTDYSDRISCYICNSKTMHNSCNGPQDLSIYNKHICSASSMRCVTFARDTDIRRGCEGDEPLKRLCTISPSLCLFCDTNYCNGLSVQESPAKCYSTRSFGSGTNTASNILLQFRKCGTLVAYNSHRNCYVAKRIGSPVIQAGCIEDYDRFSKYYLYRQGNSDIIFKDKIYCYKCQSSSYNRCHLLRYVEPQLCKGIAVDHPVIRVIG